MLNRIIRGQENRPLVSRFNADGTPHLYIRYTYDENGSVCGISTWYEGSSTAWANYYFVKNLQGDVLQVYRSGDKALMASYTYDAWGNILSMTDGNGTNIRYNPYSVGYINPFRYRGYYYDNETYFYYLQSRYYDPAIGRFVNADCAYDTNQGFLGYNMFAYCGNNPISYFDPIGLFGLEAFVGILYNAIIIAGSMFAAYYLSNAIVLGIEWIIRDVSQLFNPFPMDFEETYVEPIPQTPSAENYLEFPSEQQHATLEDVSTKGRERVRDTGLASESDEEVQKKARDKKLPSSVRQRYKREEKARGLRNVQKRKMNYTAPEGGFHSGAP